MANERQDAETKGVAVASHEDLDARYQAHPAVNTDAPCPVCGIRALHRQHCKELCLACGWYQSCVD